MNRTELDRQLRWLMILRVVTVTTLLISAFAIELTLKPGQTLRSLFVLAAVIYGMVLLYAFLDRWLKGTPGFIYLQLVGDALVVTAFVRITGGLDSPMSFLYLLPIAVASLLLWRRGGLVLAGVCFTLYAALVLNRAPSEPAESWRVSYFLIVHAVAFVSVVLLASHLSERVRVQTRELDERKGTVQRLQALNENIIESIHSGLLDDRPRRSRQLHEPRRRGDHGPRPGRRRGNPDRAGLRLRSGLPGERARAAGRAPEISLRAALQRADGRADFPGHRGIGPAGPRRTSRSATSSRSRT